MAGLLRGHPAGAGPLLRREAARAMPVVRLNQIGIGGSGVNPARLPVLCGRHQPRLHAARAAVSRYRHRRRQRARLARALPARRAVLAAGQIAPRLLPLCSADALALYEQQLGGAGGAGAGGAGAGACRELAGLLGSTAVIAVDARGARVGRRSFGRSGLAIPAARCLSSLDRAALAGPWPDRLTRSRNHWPARASGTARFSIAQTDVLGA